jgi:glucose/arabinose dehydrogenase
MSPAFHFLHRSNESLPGNQAQARFRFLASTIAPLLALSSVHGQRIITDPIPERIAKSDIRVELMPVASGLVSPVLLVVAPDNPQRFIVVDQVGKLRVIEQGKLRNEPYLDVSNRLVKQNKDFDERGLLGFAFDPDFKTGGKPGYRRVFTFTSEPAGAQSDYPIVHGDAPPDHQSVIASWLVTEDGSKVDPASRKELLRYDKPQFNHNGGMILFGPDGFLYIGTGDGGAGNDLGPGHNPEIGNGQDKNVPLGKMLRIDVNGKDSANGAYGIPKDNPYAKGGGLREIYAIGLRNPFRFTFTGGMLLACDVGQNNIEMVHSVELGGNYGWRLKEGTFKFDKTGLIEPPDASLPPGLKDPLLQYDHTEGTSVIGGYVYRGSAIPALKGKYIFGDYRGKEKPSTGRLFEGDLRTGSIKELRIGKDDRDLGFLLKGFGEDPDGELYILGSAIQGPTGNTGVMMKITSVQ